MDCMLNRRIVSGGNNNKNIITFIKDFSESSPTNFTLSATDLASYGITYEKFQKIKGFSAVNISNYSSHIITNITATDIQLPATTSIQSYAPEKQLVWVSTENISSSSQLLFVYGVLQGVTTYIINTSATQKARYGAQASKFVVTLYFNE